MWSLDPSWDAPVETVLSALFPEHPPGGSAALFDAIAQVSTAYNELRPAGGGRAALAARLAFFLRADLLKTTICLAECEAAGVTWPSKVRVLDVGAGLGAAAFGVLEAFARSGGGGRTVEQVRIQALDRDAAALEVGWKVHGAARARFPWSSWEPRLWDASREALPVQDEVDLIVASNVLCEIGDAAASEILVRSLLDRLTDSGTAILIEPALRPTSRRLHELRDSLIASKRCSVLAPCTHASPCPALAESRDWCHEDRPFQPSPGLERLVRNTGLRRGGLKFSYVTLRKDDIALGRAKGRKLRVVSDPLVSKGKLELFACGADGRKRLTMLERSRSVENEAFWDAARGDLLSIGTVDAKGRIGRDTHVEAFHLPDT